MKFVGSIVAFAVSASASHATCATATVAMDGVRYNTTFPAYTMAPGTTDAPFAALPGCTSGYYQDYFWTYTATCNGVGLVSFLGNENVSLITTAVTTGGCAAPVLAGQSDGSDSYLAADMTMSCDYNGWSGITVAGEQYYAQSNQFVAVLGTVYTIAAARYYSYNITGSSPGEEFFETLITCAAPASADCTAPTVVTEGLSFYSNFGGAAETKCTGGNDVFLEYTAPCTGSVNISLVGGDGYQGEDLQMGIYTACGADELVCKDYAYVYADDSVPAVQGFSMGGVSAGTKYKIQVGSYNNAMSPFVLDISACDGVPGSKASSAATLAAPLVALFAMFFF